MTEIDHLTKIELTLRSIDGSLDILILMAVFYAGWQMYHSRKAAQ